jgi:hypothetical protein
MARPAVCPNNDYMNLRATLVVLLCAFGAQATLTASTSYSFGTNTNVTFDSGTVNPTYTAGVWTEDFNGTNTTTTEQIVCVVGMTVANETNTCGNPGPGNAAHIGITTGGQPGSSALPTGTTNYAEIDGDPSYGAPVSTNMTGLTIGATYQVSFYQASNEEDGNFKAYNDNWNVYILPGAAAGAYICPVCATPVNPDPTDLVFTSSVMANAGSVTTPWQLQTFQFTATSATEILEFVTNAVAVTAGAFEPPLFDLAAVTTAQVAPEPGTWVLMLLGGGLVLAGTRLRKRPSTENKRAKRG